MKNLIVAIALTTATLSLSACHTVSGVGEDVQAAGGVVTKTSETVRTGSY